MSQRTSDLITTFQIGSDTFGIEVMNVQEVAKLGLIAPVPLAPAFVRGLVNLRGQIATAVGLREIFKPQAVAAQRSDIEEMSVVCKVDESLVCLIVDSIGDVVEMERSMLEEPPHTLPFEVRKYLKGIYKTEDSYLSMIDLAKVSHELSPTSENQQRINC